VAFATIVAPVVTNPGGTGSTIIPTLPTGHVVGDIIKIWVAKTGIAAWSPPAGWTTRQQTISSGTSTTGAVGTLLYHRVVVGDTLPLTSPTCNLGATVTRGAIAWIERDANIDGVYTAPAWAAFSTATGTANPVRPATITTVTPDMLVTICYCSRSATNAPEQTGYTQTQEIIISGNLVLNVSQQNVAASGTVLANQDASPTSGVRWVAMISATPPFILALVHKRGSFGQDARLRR
jgi:hypothetical protein